MPFGAEAFADDPARAKPISPRRDVINAFRRGGFQQTLGHGSGIDRDGPVTNAFRRGAFTDTLWPHTRSVGSKVVTNAFRRGGVHRLKNARGGQFVAVVWSPMPFGAGAFTDRRIGQPGDF